MTWAVSLRDFSGEVNTFASLAAGVPAPTAMAGRTAERSGLTARPHAELWS